MKVLIPYILLLSSVFSYIDEHEKISDYKIFKGDPHNLESTDGHIPYNLISPLFTDYAWKCRTLYVPNNEKIIYNNDKVFDFPVGTIISKTFYYPKDFNNVEKGISLKETRILIHKEEGWIGLPYVWNDEETEAYLVLAGGVKKAEWTSDIKFNEINYIVPNVNHCKGCHVNSEVFLPIGPKARNINSEYHYADGIKNQILKWHDMGYFKSVPDINDIPKITKWNDSNPNTIQDRARGWLDVNSAHCHNINGPANNTGLFLDYYQKDEKALGVYKTPVAAGRGSGHLQYDVVPGDPENSILYYRFNSTDPGIMMPELGRTLVHKEGLELIKDWIISLEN